jgi:TRAP-type C4-dicarboxylate transport system permease small subunit
LSALRRAADAALVAACVAALLALLGTVVAGVVFRLLDDPLIWTDEAARYLMVWLAFLGTMLAARRRGHIRINVLLDLMTGRARRVAEAAIQLAVCGFGAALLWHGITLVERAWDVEAVSLPITSAVLYLPLLPAGLWLALQAAAECAEALRE